jgi:transcriptional regulator with XRE-family HTH domain
MITTESSRTLLQQLQQVCSMKGVLKKQIACEMGIAPSYLSQLLKRGASAAQIEKIAHAVGVDPADFDEYVAKMAEAIAMHDRDLLEIIRAYAFTADNNGRTRILDSTRQP